MFMCNAKPGGAIMGSVGKRAKHRSGSEVYAGTQEAGHGIHIVLYHIFRKESFKGKR